ncbi:MAG TPA: hypothetical protein VNO14_01385 [Blastocatellia bacterium]|nr:hypothetical protein [Blastocatellia bacterium]
MSFLDKNVKEPVEKSATFGVLTLMVIIAGIIMMVIVLLLYAFE